MYRTRKENTDHARTVRSLFDAIKKRGGRAAIDYYDGTLVLRTTQPDTSNPDTWGKGAVPEPYSDSHVRIAEC